MSAETTPTKTEARGSEGQTFLVGETLYLRGRELSDAKRASAWRRSYFPVAAAQAEEQLKASEGKAEDFRSIRLIACRRVDDEAVGGVTVSLDDWQAADLTLHVDPVFGPQVAAIKAEMLRLVAPWLQAEVDRLIIWTWITTAPEDEALRAAADELGFAEVGRLRNAVWRDGARYDHCIYETISPLLRKGLGEPADYAIPLPQRAAVTAPRPRPVWPENPPRNAVVVGQRVYLRPVEVEDAEGIARWSRRETDLFHEHRIPYAPMRMAEWIKNAGKEAVPSEFWLRVALRENDELIGTVGVDDIDWIGRTGETGSELFPDYRSKGYGTEAKELLLWYLFARLGFYAVRSYVWSPNGRSAAALLKQGYRPAGRIHYVGFHLGQPADDLLFDLLATEWAERRS